MLRSFRVANHRSIRAAQELVLLPAYDKSRPVTPVAALYGANASGKSNVLDALRWMRAAVLESNATWRPRGGVPRVPFRLDPAAADEPSEFAVDIVAEGVRYHYGLAVDDRVVVGEWLHSYPKGRRRVIFDRTGQTWTFGSTVTGRLSVVSELTATNSLFLSVAARSEIEDVLPVYAWFDLSLVQHVRTTDTGSTLAEHLNAGDDRRSRLVDLIRVADFGITDVVLNRAHEDELRSLLATFEESPFAGAEVVGSDKDNPEVFHLRLPNGELTRVNYRPADRDRVLFVQGGHGVTLGIDDQSDGTRAWIEVVIDALDVLADGKVMVVDELDLSLHPRLVARLIELFADKRTNPHHAQLIFTTHDATLLGTSLGVPVLQRDEVWFVEKAADGSTSLFPLTDFHPRKEENTERRYLGGSYGAVPAVYSDSLVERLVAVREGPDRAAS